MKKYNLLIIGSNFGIYHLNASLRSKKFCKIAISSPNILEKKIPKSVEKYKNFKDALKKNDIQMISIVTKPEIQHIVLQFMYKKKIFPKYIFLEKPLLNKTIQKIKQFPKKTLFLTNFIFSFNYHWIQFKKEIIKIKENCSLNYCWFFNQAYFKNKKQTWKIDNSQGGGLIQYYLPHAIYNILNIFSNVKFIKINKKRFSNKILVYVELIFLINKQKLIVKISNNSRLNLHKFEVFNKADNKKYLLVNNSKKWLSNFEIFIKGKKIKKIQKFCKKGDGRENVLFDIYSNINKYFTTKNIARTQSLTYKTFAIIDKINKKINDT